MSETSGSSLTPEILATFDGGDLGAKIGLAYLLVTSDDDGTPRPCMLSVGEILAADEGHLRLALWRGTRTSANLARGSTAVLCYVEPGTVSYVRGRPRALAGGDAEHLDFFEIDVTSVDTDLHAGMPVTDTIRFTVTSQPLDEVEQEWVSRLAVLRRARPA